MPDSLPLMRRILIGLDGSEVSLKALRVGGGIARVSGATLLLAHVVQPARHAEEPADLTPLDRLRQEHRFGEQVLRDALAATPGLQEIPCMLLVLRGEPSSALVQAAIEHSADLVVVGTRGLGGVRGLLGSVSRRVVSRSAGPVLVVR